MSEESAIDATERYYVQTIRDVAERYRAMFRRDNLIPDDRHVIAHWEAIKQKLGPSTAIAVCDAWLAANPGQQIDGQEAE